MHLGRPYRQTRCGAASGSRGLRHTADVLALDEAGYRAIFRGSATKRAKQAELERNAVRTHPERGSSCARRGERAPASDQQRRRRSASASAQGTTRRPSSVQCGTAAASRRPPRGQRRLGESRCDQGIPVRLGQQWLVPSTKACRLHAVVASDRRVPFLCVAANSTRACDSSSCRGRCAWATSIS